MPIKARHHCERREGKKVCRFVVKKKKRKKQRASLLAHALGSSHQCGVVKSNEMCDHVFVLR